MTSFKHAKFAVAMAAPILLSTAFISQAGAHATLEQAEAQANSYHKATIRIGHGCDGQATNTLTVYLPEGFIAAKPMPKAGWTLEITTAKFGKSYENHGTTIDEGVTQIRWTGGALADAHYDEFVLRGRITGFEAGTRLPFKVVQSCANGEARWDQVAADGQDPHELANPAPLLTIVASDGHDGHSGHGAHSAMDKADAVETGSASVGDLVITGAWTRQAPPSARVVGGYASITNNGQTADRLIAASAGFADRTEVHEMTVTDGVMRMNELAGGLEIKPGETVELKPGSFHLMFMEATSPKEGETVPVTLVFETAGEVVVQMPVAAIGAGAAPGMDHGSMNHGTGGKGHNHGD